MSNFESNVKNSVKALTYMLDMELRKYDIMGTELTHYTAEPPKKDMAGDVVMTLLISEEMGSPELSDIAQTMNKMAEKIYNILPYYTFNIDGKIVKRTKDEYFDSDDIFGMVYKMEYKNESVFVEFSNYYTIYYED